MTYTFGDKLRPTIALLEHGGIGKRFDLKSRALYIGANRHACLMLVVQGRKKVEHFDTKYWTKE